MREGNEVKIFYSIEIQFSIKSNSPFLLVLVSIYTTFTELDLVICLHFISTISFWHISPHTPQVPVSK